jgi:hypothetical protein
MPSFLEHQGTNLAPGWLRGDAGRAFLEAFGAMKDAQVARAKEAVKCRFPAGTAVPELHLGNQVTASVVLTLAGDDKLAYAFQLGETRPFTFARINTSQAGRRGRVILYSSVPDGAAGVDGRPDALLAVSAEFVSVDGWNEGIPIGPITLEPGTYFVGVITSTDGLYGVRMGPETPGRPCFYGSDTYSDSPEATWSPGGANMERVPCIELVSTTRPGGVEFDNAAPFDALAIIAAERGIDRGATESEASFRSRVRSAWDVWRWAGTPYGLLLAFYWAGYRPTSGKVVLQTQGGKQHELRADFDPTVHTPENALVVTNLGLVHLGGTPELWSDFAVVFLSPTPPSWLPTPPADGSAEVEAIRRLISKWKAAHARCVRLRVSTVDLWDYPAETWEPTTEVWDETGVTSDWTPPAG